MFTLAWPVKLIPNFGLIFPKLLDDTNIYFLLPKAWKLNNYDFQYVQTVMINRPVLSLWKNKDHMPDSMAVPQAAMLITKQEVQGTAFQIKAQLITWLRKWFSSEGLETASFIQHKAKTYSTSLKNELFMFMFSWWRCISGPWTDGTWYSKLNKTN